MRRLAAIVHTHNDGLRLGRCLETLYPCDEILIVDHGSNDQTLRVACQYGATVVRGRSDSSQNDYLQPSGAGWILCLEPCESLTEGLAASLFQWKLQRDEELSATSFSTLVREETSEGWSDHKTPQTRLVPRNWQLWRGTLPVSDGSPVALEGEVLRFSFP